MVDQHQRARQHEHGFGQLDDGEAAEVLAVHEVAGDGEGGKGPGEAVDQGGQHVEAHDGVDQARERLSGGNGVLFNELGEVVEAGGDG